MNSVATINEKRKEVSNVKVNARGLSWKGRPIFIP
jgi:hypothetical protein